VVRRAGSTGLGRLGNGGPGQLVSAGSGWRAGSKWSMPGRAAPVIDREGDGLPVTEGEGESRLQRVCKVVETELRKVRENILSY
jgi:hypothetical protein